MRCCGFLVWGHACIASTAGSVETTTHRVGEMKCNRTVSRVQDVLGGGEMVLTGDLECCREAAIGGLSIYN